MAVVAGSDRGGVRVGGSNVEYFSVRNRGKNSADRVGLLMALDFPSKWRGLSLHTQLPFNHPRPRRFTF